MRVINFGQKNGDFGNYNLMVDFNFLRAVKSGYEVFISFLFYLEISFRYYYLYFRRHLFVIK